MAAGKELFRKNLHDSLGVNKNSTNNDDGTITDTLKNKSNDATKDLSKLPIQPLQVVKNNEISSDNKEGKTKQNNNSIDTSNIGNNEIDSLNDYVKDILRKIDEKRRLEASNEYKFKKGDIEKFDDKYPALTVTVRKDYHDVINNLLAKSSLKKYQLIELIIYNGLKHTNFD